MTTSTILVHTPEFKQNVASFYDLFAYHIIQGITFPIAVFFSEFPLNPSSTAVRKRLLDRGGITITQGNSVNEYKLTTLDPRERSLKVTFEDANLGTIILNLPPVLSANAKLNGSILSLELSTTVFVEFYLGGLPPSVDRIQRLCKIAVERAHQVTYYFQSKDNPEQTLVIVNSFTENAFARQAPKLEEKTYAMNNSSQDDLDLNEGAAPSFYLALFGLTCACCSKTDNPDSKDSWVIRRNPMNEICYIQKVGDTVIANTEPLTDSVYGSPQTAQFARETYVQQGICKLPPMPTDT